MIPLRDYQPSLSTPWVTLLLILTNCVVFAYELTLDPFSLNELFHTYGLIPAHPEATTFLTSMFLHGGWLHLIGNMWFLWIFGDNVEDVMGHGRYLVFYLLCGIAAGLVHVIFMAGSRVPTVGASGAIAGVMGAYMVKFPAARIVTLVPMFFVLTTVEVPAGLMLLYWFVLQLLSGAGSLLQPGAGGGIAWFAHAGGFVAGIVLLKLLGSRPRYRRRVDWSW